MSVEQGPWVGDKWWVSHFNYAEEVRKNLRLPSRVEIYDVTLRDGEQTPGVVFKKEEKIHIAQLLDEAGVHRIEAGMPVVSPEDADAVKAIAHAGLKAKVFGFCRMIKGDIDAAIKSDVQGVIIEGPVGVPKLKQFGWPYEDVVKRAIEAVDYAKAHGLYTAFFSVDITRAELSFAKRLLSEIGNQTRVDSFIIADTFGCTLPEAVSYLIRELKKTVRQPLEMHCHNDFGLGTACTLAGIAAGAEVAHTAVNGLGERTGNASFEEVVMGLKYLYGIDIGIKTEMLCKISRIVEQYSQFKVPVNKPFIGERAFTREAGISIAGWVKYYLGSEPILPELVGNRHGIVIGKKSGRHSVEWKLQQLGLQAPPEKIPLILEEIKNESVRKKAAIDDEDFKKIVAKVLSS
jgi:methanogen homocitrate synthase